MVSCIDFCCYKEGDLPSTLMCLGGSDIEILEAFEERDGVPYIIEKEKLGQGTLTTYRRRKNSPFDYVTWAVQGLWRYTNYSK